MLNDEAHAKYILSNSVSDQIKEEINFSAYTCFEIWNILKESYRKSREEKNRRYKRKNKK